jgi:hypothetical protein
VCHGEGIGKVKEGSWTNAQARPTKLAVHLNTRRLWTGCGSWHGAK